MGYALRVVTQVFAAWSGEALLPQKGKIVQKNRSAPELGEYYSQKEAKQRRKWLMDHPDFVESQMNGFRRNKILLREDLRGDPDKLFENACIYSSYGMKIRRRKEQENLTPLDGNGHGAGDLMRATASEGSTTGSNAKRSKHANANSNGH